MCSGRVDLGFVLRSFLNGMDGVFIGGCRLNECNYITHGNYHALNMTMLCKRILEHVGLNPDRLKIEFMSSGDGILFAEVVSNFCKEIEALGPIGRGEGLDENELASRLREVLNLVPYIKLAKKDKLALRLGGMTEYEDLYTREEIDRLLTDVVTYRIDPEKCRACMICLRKCPVGAISGGKKQIHVIDQATCIRCGTCFEVCPPRFAAVEKLSGQGVSLPPSEEERTAAGN